MNYTRATTCLFSEAASLGLRPFPVVRRGKNPDVTSLSTYFKRAPTPEELGNWDARDTNIGIICGSETGLLVVDADTPEAIELIEGLMSEPTPTVQTAKGKHYYYQHPGIPVGNRVDVDSLGFDIRSNGGYVVGVGSVHESGHVYEWLVTPAEVPFAEVPFELLQMILTAGTSSGSGGSKSRSAGRVDIPDRHGLERLLAFHLREAYQSVVKAKESSRNDTLNKEAFVLAMHVAAAEADWGSYADKLAEAAAICGLDPKEAARTIQSAWKAGSQTPRHWVRIANEYVFLAEQNRFHNTRTRTSLTLAGFNGKYGRAHMGPGLFGQYLLDFGFIEKVQ